MVESCDYRELQPILVAGVAGGADFVAITKGIALCVGQ
jgi:hypothetical protein